jgi:hypothetical protein
LLINEFSSSNVSSLTDEDREYYDWIELYNRSASEINLNGYYLSDTVSFLKKWKFPSVPIKPFSYLLVFASGKNRTELPVNYKTIISWGDDWKYLVPTAEPANGWKYPGFNTSLWGTGKSGFGISDNDDSTVLNSNLVSVFIRKEFTIEHLDDIVELVLSIDYDDGFIAYINGYEIARSNLGTNPTVPFNQVTGSLSREATMYSGGYPENFIIKNPKTFLNKGTNVIAIQGHNSSATSSDFSLIPFLTIGLNSTEINDSVPNYISLKGRRLHTNFKIDNEGETLILSKPDSSVVDSVSPVRLTANLSFGRKPDGAKSWSYFAVPTPNMPNITRGFNYLNTDTVIFSSQGGYYPGGLTLTLSSKYLSDSIFYTLDGSEPELRSSRYSGPITLKGNAVVRAISIKSDKLPGEIFTNTYVTRRHTLPVVCISTDPKNLWDYNTGIYVMGPNASTTNPYFGANFWMDWEREAHMELYDTDGKRQINQDVGIQIFGAYSRARPQKSLALFARKEYGKGSFDYKIFNDKPINKFEALVLRNSGNDWSNAFIRDGLTSVLVHDMDIDRLAFQPAVVYLNGEYWGIQDLREKINANYLEENHFVDPYKVNLLVANSTVIEGANSAYVQLTNFLNSNSLESELNYKQAESKIDVNNYIQYQLAQIYIDNRDWPGNNIKYWNTNDQGSLWRWIMYDTDFGFGYKGSTAYNFNTLNWALTPDATTGANRPWATLLFRRMISNPGFKKEFANQYADRINRNFSSERALFVHDSILKIYLPEMPYHLAMWNLTLSNWNNHNSIVRSFASSRPDYARNHLRSELGLGELLQVKVDINEPGIGKVKINSIIPYKFPFEGKYFRDLPIKLTAIPSPGYRFVRWEVGGTTSPSPSIDYNMTGPGNFRAVFSTARRSDTKIVINEINYKSFPSKDTEDWIELYNAGLSTVNLKNWIISDGDPEKGFVIQTDFIFYPGMYIVICRDLAAFRSNWTRVVNSIGDFEFGLDSSGDDVNLYDPEGNLVDFVNFDNHDPWPRYPDNSGGPIELTDPFSDNNAGQNWKSTIQGGSPGFMNTKLLENSSAERSEIASLTSYPNPFTDYTTFRIDVAVAGKYRVEVYNMHGKLLNTILDQNLEKGDFYIDWYGDSGNDMRLPVGVYIVRLSGEKYEFNTRVIVLK